MNTLPTITFDIDGVWANFTKGFGAVIAEHAGVQYGAEWPSWFPSRDGYMHPDHWQLGLEQIVRTPSFWALLDAYPHSPFAKVEALMQECLITGYFVSVRRHLIDVEGITDARVLTRLWLERHGIESAQGVIVGKIDRAPLLKLLGADAHIDDCGEQAVELREAGINCYLINRSWNRDVDFPTEFRVDSVDEFLEKAVAPLLPEGVRASFFTTPDQTKLCSYDDFTIADVARVQGRMVDLPERQAVSRV